MLIVLGLLPADCAAKRRRLFRGITSLTVQETVRFLQNEAGKAGKRCAPRIGDATLPDVCGGNFAAVVGVIFAAAAACHSVPAFPLHIVDYA